MKNYFVACTAVGRRLVIARVGKADTCLDQKDCEGEIMKALVDKFMDGKPQGQHQFTLAGKPYTLTLTANS